MKFQQSYLRWHSETHRQYAGPQTGTHKHVAPTLDYVAVCIALSVFGGHYGTAEQRQAHLPAMRMAGDEQAEPTGDYWKDVGIVSEH